MCVPQPDEGRHIWCATGPVGEFNKIDRHEGPRDIAQLKSAAQRGRSIQRDRVSRAPEGYVGERGTCVAHERLNGSVGRQRPNTDREPIAVPRKLNGADWHALVCDDELRGSSFSQPYCGILLELSCRET